MDDVTTRRVKTADEVEPLQGLPEPAPRRLDLPRAGNAIGVGTDCKERGVAEIQQAGEADDDVEAKRQRGKGERVRRRINVGIVAVNQWEQQSPYRDQQDTEAGPRARGKSREDAPADPDRQQC